MIVILSNYQNNLAINFIKLSREWKHYFFKKENIVGNRDKYFFWEKSRIKIEII